MMLNLKLEKFQEEIVNEMVDRGIASNKSEAIRMMIIHYNEHFELRPMTSDEKAIRKMQKIDQEIAEGKRKLISAKEAFGEKYAKMLEK